MEEDGLPGFLQLNGFRVRQGMFGARRTPLVSLPIPSPSFAGAPWGEPGNKPAEPPAPPFVAVPPPTVPPGSLPPQAPPGGPTPARNRRSALTDLAVGKDQLENWIKGINQSGGLDEPEPGPNTLNSDRDVVRAMAHAATDKGGADTIEAPDLDDFVDRFRQVERKLQLNGLTKGRRPEIFFTVGRDDRGQVVLRSLQAVGQQGQRAPQYRRTRSR